MTIEKGVSAYWLNASIWLVRFVYFFINTHLYYLRSTLDLLLTNLQSGLSGLCTFYKYLPPLSSKYF